MKKDNIIIVQEANNWEEAIKVSGSLLVKASSCTSDYVEEMIDAVKKLGPYIVIVPYIALAHAKPSKLVIKDDISLAVFKEPIDFGHKNNDPVSLVFSLCATEDSGHLEQLSKLSNTLLDNNIVEAIISCNTIDEIYDILNEK